METNWFAGTTRVDQVKTLFRKLAMEWHPDRGTTEQKPERNRIMAEIIEAYHRVLAGADGETYKGDDEREHTYRYNPQTEEEVLRKVMELLGLRMQGVEVWLVGTWVWAVGETKPYREALKAAGCIWNPRRVAWFWRRPENRGWGRSPESLDTLMKWYGGRVYEQATDSSVAAA